jgi:hypothetical protein
MFRPALPIICSGNCGEYTDQLSLFVNRVIKTTLCHDFEESSVASLHEKGNKNRTEKRSVMHS